MSKKHTCADLPKRYHPVLVSFHWIIALLIFSIVLLAGIAEDSRATLFGIPLIGIHMLTGITILVLVTLRLVTRLTTIHPEPATTRKAMLDRIGVWTHYGLHFFTHSMTISGITMAAQRGYFARIFGIGSTPAAYQPNGFFLGALLGLSWLFLELLFLVHISTALYHQFIRKDQLLARMWVGR